jgi:APA family basic amino acid/polyamine antiporter
VSTRSFSPLARAADKPALLRQLGVISATALVISNMIGQGIFTSTGYLAADLGSPQLILLIWIVGAFCALAGAFCYSELGVNFPSSGGEYVYLSKAYGPTWGFMTGWISFFAGFSAPIAAAALAFSDYLGYFIPATRQANSQFTFGSGAWTWHFGMAQLVACALVGVFTILNLFGVQRVARVQNLLTSLKVAMLCAFLVLAFTVGNGNWGNFALTTARDSARPLPAQFAISLFWIYVAYSGWNAATYVAEELKQPARTLPLALAAGTGIVAVLFVALNIAFIYAVPLGDMKGVLAIGSLAASRLFGPEIAGIFSALMALGLLSTVNAMVTVGPRVYYAMAKNRAFFRSAALVHPRWHTPVVAILAQGLCTMVMTLAPFRELISYIGILLNLFAVMSVASIFLFRRRPGWQKLRVVSFLYPVIPVFFVAVGLWMTYQGIRQQPVVSAAAALTIATGALFYRMRIHDQRI